MKKLNLVGLGTAGKRSYFVLEKKNIFSRYFNEILEKLGIEEKVYDKEYDSVLESIEEKNNEIEHFKNEYFDIDVIYTADRIIVITRAEDYKLKEFKSLMLSCSIMNKE